MCQAATYTSSNSRHQGKMHGNFMPSNDKPYNNNTTRNSRACMFPPTTIPGLAVCFSSSSDKHWLQPQPRGHRLVFCRTRFDQSLDRSWCPALALGGMNLCLSPLCVMRPPRETTAPSPHPLIVRFPEVLSILGRRDTHENTHPWGGCTASACWCVRAVPRP